MMMIQTKQGMIMREKITWSIMYFHICSHCFEENNKLRKFVINDAFDALKDIKVMK